LIEMIYALQLDVGNGTVTHVYGIELDVAHAVSWMSAAGVAILGAFTAFQGARYFKVRWDSVQRDIALSMAKAAA